MCLSIEEGDKLRACIITDQLTWFILTSFFPLENCPKQQYIEYLKLETPKVQKEKKAHCAEQKKGNIARNISSLFNIQYFSVLFFSLSSTRCRCGSSYLKAQTASQELFCIDILWYMNIILWLVQ